VKYEFAALILIATDDPVLSKTGIVDSMRTASGASALRHAVLKHLPADLTRLVAVMPVEESRLIMMLHEAVGREITGGRDVFQRPPGDYVPPTRD
jgi:hypothetical protein